MRDVVAKVSFRYLPVGLFAFAFVLDFAAHWVILPASGLRWIRELLVAAGLLLLAPAIATDKRIVRTALLEKLKIILLALWTTIVVTYALRGLKVLTALVAGILGIGMLVLLRDLVFYQRRPTTGRNFRVLLYSMGALVLYITLAKSPEQFQGGFTDLGVPGWVLFFVMLNAMVINSFRNSWVNFLNKKQKVRVFWGGIPVLLGALWLLQLATQPPIVSSSLMVSAFTVSIGLFLAIYSGMALGSLLLHLPTASIFDKKMKEVTSLQELSATISGTLEFDQLVVRITELACGVTNAYSCWLELLDREAHKLIIASAKNFNVDWREMNLDPAKGVSGSVIRHKEAVIINEITKDPEARYLAQWRFGSILGVPLLVHGEVIGILYAVKREEFGFDDEDRRLLQAFANQAGVALENSRLIKAVIEKERLQEELRIAHDAQMKLLPKRMPQVPGLEIDAVCITANEVGGDYYDFVQFNPRRLGIVIGDVSGKGPSGAFYMAELKGIIEALSPVYDSPRELLKRVNETLYGNLDRKTFVSLLYALLEAQTRHLVFSRAGHCPLLYYERATGDCRFLQPRGIGLGLDRGQVFNETIEEQHLDLKPGDVLLFYTDGLVEARDKQMKEFEEGRLAQTLQRYAPHPATEIRAKLVAEMTEFLDGQRSHDDLTFVLVKCT